MSGRRQRFEVNFRKFCSSVQAGWARRARVNKAAEERLRREIGKREREKDSTENDEASEERLPGEAERRV
ncbi:hypothetical protein CYMTET_16046 [Cymbomonas tetramitiformis]|uniref:Uncharacterized protein n=1 Tax=Cymbomonas tetramitiformis TaxID=36881 RepID=A0AAE0GD52_9CHLO|nr:hypothetical protein CYMTET_16046 [Cymbomonas tetramitiformis]